MRSLFLSIILFGCSGHHEAQPAAQQNLLQARATDWRIELQSEVVDGHLYAHPLDCDYTLWAGKAAAAGVAVDLDQMEYNSGEIHRRPGAECYPDDSDSTISNDQLTGYMAGRYRTGDLAALQRLADYATAKHYVMGDPLLAIGDVVMKEPLRVLLHRMIYSLSAGADDRSYRKTTPVYLPVSADYARHIQTLQIIFHGEVHGSIDDQMLARLKDMADAGLTPQAALAVYTGNYDDVTAVLLADPVVMPSYVRGERPDVYAKIEALFAADLILRYQESP